MKINVKKIKVVCFTWKWQGKNSYGWTTSRTSNTV